MPRLQWRYGNTNVVAYYLTGLLIALMFNQNKNVYLVAYALYLNTSLIELKKCYTHTYIYSWNSACN